MTDASTSDLRVCSLQVFGRANLPIAGAVVAEAVRGIGLGSRDSNALSCVTQELAEVVVDSGFAVDEPAVVVEVSVERRPGGVAVVIADQGAPSVLTSDGAQPPRLAELVRLGFADELSFAHHGRGGNSAELFKRLTYRSIVDDVDFENEPAPAPDGVAEPVLEFRPLETSDILDVARLFYRCYGYSAYQIAVVYEPELLTELMAAGKHRATIALADGVIVGHIASTIDSPTARVGLIGMLVVDPAYRKFKIAAKLTFNHSIRMIEAGFIGQYSSCVTAHTASQRIALKFAGHEVALLVAEQQPSLQFKDIDDPDGEPSTLRRANVWFFNSIGGHQHRQAHVPPMYVDIVRQMFEQSALDRSIAPANLRPGDDLADTCELDLVLKHEAKIATIKVATYGRDFVTSVQRQLNELCLNRFDVIRLVLPLSDPATSFYGSGLGELGFFFCGINPEVGDGDALVLQYLNNVEVDPDRILMASEFGTTLRDFVFADRERALRVTTNRVRSRAHMARIYDALR